MSNAGRTRRTWQWLDEISRNINVLYHDPTFKTFAPIKRGNNRETGGKQAGTGGRELGGGSVPGRGAREAPRCK
jgi:hypothetical protein